MKYSFIAVLPLVFTVCVLGKEFCEDGNHNWKLLDGPPWEARKINSLKVYQISLCNPLNYDTLPGKNCNNSSLCVFENGTAWSLANYSSYDATVKLIGVNVVQFGGPPCFQDHTHRTVFRFTCGRHLNFPEVSTDMLCLSMIFWNTLAACKEISNRKEVACYVYGEDGNITDLTPLIKTKGGYSVLSTDIGVDFFINVCSDIVPDGETTGCPHGAAACRKIGSEFLSFGSLDTPVFSSDSNLKITYKTKNASTPAGCNMPPSTTITFKCPPKGRSHGPRLVESTNCQYEIEWQTEQSCQQHLVTTDLGSCRFTRERHNVDLDLSPLQKKDGDGVYIVNGTQGRSFKLNVCSGLGNNSCQKWKSIAACMDDVPIGLMSDASLSYLDGRVKLIYKGGKKCNSSEIPYRTIIEFQCDPTAGVGTPILVDDEDCDFVFNWATQHACPKHLLSDRCYIDENNIHIDLELLIRNPSEKPWQVLNSKEADNGTYYLNICHGISKNLGASNCDSSAAVCRVDSNGTSFNYGKFTSPPTYNKDSRIVSLVYSEGDACGDRQRETRINLLCRPGVLDSPPILESISDDGCHAVIQWQTAAACPQATVKGNDCKVVDNDLGLEFDLNPLKNDKYYEVKAGDFTYYLNVCGKVNGTKCDGTHGNLNAAACQEGETAIKLGEPSSELIYRDGIIKLTYKLGTRYNDTGKTPRTTTITFLCDEKVGAGHPEFHKETGPVYYFFWYTSYACPSKAFECVARDPTTNMQYDLSRLTRTKGELNWMVSDHSESLIMKFYLNICGSLTATETPCSSTSSACVVEVDQKMGSEKVINIGKMTQSPETKNGLTQLNYTDGDNCTQYGKDITYGTLIHFICSKNDEHLSFLGKSGNCQYSFLMETSAACPIEQTKSENWCSIKDPFTGTVYNFTHLKEKYYNVTDGDRRYQVKICGAGKGGCNQEGNNSVTVCEVDEKGSVKKNIGFLNGYSLQILDNFITLIYKGTHNESTGITSKVYITFKCTKQQNDSITFEQEDSHGYYFELSTPAACSSNHADCSFVDGEGNEYDLMPLIKRGDLNWEAADNREGYTDQRYHINFCAPLNPSLKYKCPAGAISACQTSTKHEEEGISLGFSQRPIVKEDKIVISYTDGSPCGDGSLNHSAEVTLHCSEKQSELILLGESETCAYFFYMYTPAACPLKEYVGNDCKVSVPGYNYHFDLSHLRQTNSRYEVIHGDYVYLLNICGPVAAQFSSCLGAGVCQTKPSDPKFAVDAGKANSELVYKNGVVELRYENGKGNCHRKYNRTTVITFICNPSGKKESGPAFLSEDTECNYFFEWQTSLVCLEHEVQECSVSSDTEHYDLSPLSSSTYSVTYGEQQFAISVCNRLSQSKYGKVCSMNSAACIIKYGGDDTIVQGINIGDIGTPFLEDGVLKLRYRHGDACHMDPSRKLQTVIEFDCDEKAPLDTKPMYVGSENCTYSFEWRHRAACPVKKETPMDNCTAINPVTGFTFDLSPLRRETHYTVSTENHKYRLNVCGVVKNTRCGGQSGSCQEDGDSSRKWNSGNFNSKLDYREGVLMLKYTGGDICHKQYNRSTVIEFSCGVGIGHPTFISESYDCIYLFSWSTVYACEDRVPCFVTNGNESYDLSSLTLDKGHHTAVNTIDEDEYIINVCSPLNNPNPLCHGAGICRIGTSAVSIGRPYGPPFFDFLGHVTALYTHGASCSRNDTNKARIIFLCNSEAGRGEPSLSSKNEEQCIYIFDWETSLVCPEKKHFPPTAPPPVGKCKYVDNNRGIDIDLSPLRKINSSYEVTSKRGDEKFTINICGPAESGVSDCSTAGVCFHGMADKENFGSVNNATFSYSDKELALTYSNGGSCPLSESGRRSSTILFTCDENAGNGFPVLHKKSACLATFKWKTSLVCIEKPPFCTFKKGSNFYDLRLLSSISHSWNLSDSNGNTYWINVCRAINVDFGPENCIYSGVCVQLSNGTFLSLGSLLSWNLDAADSGEVILTYHYNSEACPGNSGTSTVKFICGKKMGVPKFKSGSFDSCNFEFVWESTEACAENRKEVLHMENKSIYDPRLQHYFDMSALYNRTFTIGPTGKDGYIYIIKFNGVGSFGSRKECDNAVVCQTKPETFYRDIGTVSTEMFFLKGNELILELTSFGRKCGKNKNKNVTTIINFSCSSAAGVGLPVFYYESGNCDYLFEWDTELVCPNSAKTDHKPDGGDADHVIKVPSKGESSSSYALKIVVGIFLSSTLIALIFILAKEERRKAIKRKIINAFENVQLPKMFYRRGNSETLLLSSGTRHRDDSDVEILT